MKNAKAVGITDRIPYFPRYIAGSILLVVSPALAYLSSTRSISDTEFKENTLPSLRAAARRTPGNAAVHVALGVQLELAGQDPEPEFRTAAHLDPFWAEPLIRLGLLAESRGNTAAAERLLLEAAAADHQFGPRVTLMRFYARQRQADPFWRWARLALERSYGDRWPLFDACWSMAGEPADVYAKAVPRTRDILEAYLGYLLAHHLEAYGAGPAHDLLNQAVPENRDLLLDYCDRSIDLSPSEAVAVWNDLARRKLLRYGPIDPQHAPGTVNAGFANDPLGRAFDWRITSDARVSAARVPGGGMEMSFTGRQPEAMELMSQAVPVVAGTKYRVVISFHCQNIPIPSGIAASVENRNGGAPLATVALAPAEGSAEARLEFEAPASGVVSLKFRYQRPLGAVRTEGTLVLETVRLEPAQ